MSSRKSDFRKGEQFDEASEVILSEKKETLYMLKKDAVEIAGADEVEYYILLAMQKSPFLFEAEPEGVFLAGQQLARTVPVEGQGKGAGADE